MKHKNTFFASPSTLLKGGQEENAALQLRWVRDEMAGIGGVLLGQGS